MSEHAARFMRGKRPPREAPRGTPVQERRALAKMRQEAREAGVELTSNGKGGLPPSLVLGILRRDKFICHVCGTNGKGRGGIGVHHKAGIVESKWLSRKGHANEPGAIVTICDACHDGLHNRAREEGTDSSQVLPEGDVGNPKYDHGQPVAKFGKRG